MRRYFSKAIFINKKYELSTISVLYFTVFLLNIIYYFLYFKNKGFYNQEIMLSTGNMISTLFVIAYVITLYSEKESMYLQLLSEPRNKDSIILTNILTPISIIFFITLVYGVISSLTLLFTIPSLDFLIYFWGKLAGRFLWMFCLNSYLQMFQLLIKNKFLALILSLISLPILALFLLSCLYGIGYFGISIVLFLLSALFIVFTIALNRALRVESL